MARSLDARLAKVEKALAFSSAPKSPTLLNLLMGLEGELNDDGSIAAHAEVHYPEDHLWEPVIPGKKTTVDMILEAAERAEMAFTVWDANGLGLQLQPGDPIPAGYTRA